MKNMKSFSISEVYIKENMRTIDINPLDKKYCSFDCVFCPYGRTIVKTYDSFDFEKNDEFLIELENSLKINEIDLVYIDPLGESLANNRFSDIIDLVKEYKSKIKILSNGYIFNDERYLFDLNKCDEVIGELAVTTEEKFIKIQRPIKGFTLEKYIGNMTEFNEQFNGIFSVDITILKNISDSEDDIDKFIKFLEIIKPDKISIGTSTNEKLKGKFQVNDEKLKHIESKLLVRGEKMIEKDKMLAGELYNPYDEMLVNDRFKAKTICQKYNQLLPKDCLKKVNY